MARRVEHTCRSKFVIMVGNVNLYTQMIKKFQKGLKKITTNTQKYDLVLGFAQNDLDEQSDKNKD